MGKSVTSGKYGRAWTNGEDACCDLAFGMPEAEARRSPFTRSKTGDLGCRGDLFAEAGVLGDLKIGSLELLMSWASVQISLLSGRCSEPKDSRSVEKVFDRTGRGWSDVVGQSSLETYCGPVCCSPC